MDRAAGRITVKLRQIQRLRNYTLAGESRVAMDQQRNHTRALRIAQPVLFGAHDAFYDRIDRLQVAWVRRNRHHDLLA